MVSKSDICDLFESAESLLEEAQEGLTSFISSAATFSQGNHPTTIADPEAKTGNYVIKVRFPSPPGILRRKAYRVVTDARSSLDQAIYAATVCFDGKTHGTKTYFPFAMNPDDFDAQFIAKHGRTKDATIRIAPTIKNFEPWWTGPSHIGGNDLLRILGKISGPNKHQVGLTTVPQFHANWYSDFQIEKSLGFRMPPERIGSTNDFMVAKIAGDGGIKYDGGFTYSIGLSEPRFAIPRAAQMTLTEMLNISKNLVVAIKDVCIHDLT